MISYEFEFVKTNTAYFILRTIGIEIVFIPIYPINVYIQLSYAAKLFSFCFTLIILHPVMQFYTHPSSFFRVEEIEFEFVAYDWDSMSDDYFADEIITLKP